jgi:RimJ/RimL family protein N-acetyltransferase
MFAGHRLFRGYTNWVLEEKETGAFVGRVGPWFPEGWPHVEIGWSVIRPRWGRGYALEAARAAARWVHEELRLNEVIHLIDPENTKSARVAEKLGATPTEMFRMPFRDGREVRIWRTRLPVAS